MTRSKIELVAIDETGKEWVLLEKYALSFKGETVLSIAQTIAKFMNRYGSWTGFAVPFNGKFEERVYINAGDSEPKFKHSLEV